MAENDTDRRLSQVNRILGYATTSTTVVLTALFIQKSDGNSALETVVLLGVAAAGAFLVAAAFAGLAHRSDPQSHRLSWYLSKRALSVIGGLVGVVLVVFSMVRIDREDSDYGQPPAQHQGDGGADSTTAGGSAEIVVDSDSINLRNLIVSSNDQAVRMVMSVVNTSKAPVVLSSATVTNAGESTKQCGNSAQHYSLEGEVYVDEKGRARAELRADEGPLAGFTVQAKGVYVDECSTSGTGITLWSPSRWS